MKNVDVVKILFANLPDLSSFSANESDIHDVFEAHGLEQMLVLCHFDGQKSYSIDVKGNYSAQYIPAVAEFLLDVLKIFNLPKGKILICLHDALWKQFVDDVPILCFGKQILDNRSLMIPDPYYINSFGYAENYPVINNILDKLPWEDRMPGVLWRGSSTGYPTLSMSNWRENPRYKLCLISKQLDDRTLLDAAITQIVQCDNPEVEEEIRASGVLRPWANFEENIPYRYQLEIDGNASSWGGYQRYLLQGVQFKVESKFSQWYHPLLGANENFIPIKEDLSDLVSNLLIMRSNEEHAKKLADASKMLAEDTSYDVALLYTGELLRQLLEAQS